MIRRLLFAAAISVASLSASAAYSLVFEMVNPTARTCRVVDIQNPEQVGSALTIPSTATGTLNGYAVVEIAPDALHDMPQVTQIIIPGSVTKIGTIADNYIGYARNFYNCPKLQRYTVAATNAVFASNVDGLLTSKDGEILILTPQAMPVSNYSYTVPSAIVALSHEAFQENSTIRTLTLGSISSVGTNAGLNSMKLLSEIITTGTGTNYRAIGGCLINTADSRVVSCPPKKMAGTMSPPGGCSKIGAYAFANCIYLTALSNTYSITSIGTGAFVGSGIKTAQFESKLTEIEPYAFASCPSLETITLKSKLEALPTHVASDCPKLTKVSYTAGTPARIGTAAFANCSSLSDHPFTNFQIGDSCFFNTGFTEVNFVCDTPTYIYRYDGNHAFDSCLKLTKIDATGYATTIDKPFNVQNEYASNCPRLAEVRFPKYTQFVQNYYSGNYISSPIFHNVPNLTKIVLGYFTRYYHAHDPLFYFTGSTLVKPHIYIKNNGLVSQDGEGADLYQLCAPMNEGATIKPIYYWESCYVTAKYADKNAYYYMPGGCIEEYQQAAANGCVNEEFFRLKFRKTTSGSYPNCFGLTTKEIYPDMVKLGTFNLLYNNAPYSYTGGTYGDFTTSLAFDYVNSFTINYTVHGEQFSTTYPQSFMSVNAAGVEDVEIDATDAPAEYFNLQGVRVDQPSAGNIYIVRRGSVATKELVR